MSAEIKVFAPASAGNCIVGFDVLGLCLEKPGDEVIVRFTDNPGLRITSITGDEGQLPYEVEKNTAGWAAQTFLNHIGRPDVGIEMEIHKKMPFGSGLGSSAASAVAGVFAVNELLERPLEKKELLPFAMKGEMLASGARHADNIAPSLLGGIILTRDNETLDVHRINVPAGLYATVIYPKVEVMTKAARDILSPDVPLQKMVQQSANLGAFVLGMFKEDLELVKRSLQDVVIEPQRAHLIPHFSQVKNAAMAKGALGCSISGAGPSIFALCANGEVAERAGSAMQSVFNTSGIKSNLYISKINEEGAVRL